MLGLKLGFELYLFIKIFRLKKLVLSSIFYIIFLLKIKIRIEIDVTYAKILVWLSSLGDI